ncbi:hypothetical protein RHMOL_Rhmol04G0289900 [Rhododendron molle]|uniref:Uncharacterized protein n=1 Tax=Rhododendron molle TaxID=49168 RepID=A0ACC0P5Q5_RHOML|nr:hypothetical protein RHMOL_Rhmol04G0289900 [Rhododendron molle]
MSSEVSRRNGENGALNMAICSMIPPPYPWRRQGKEITVYAIRHGVHAFIFVYNEVEENPPHEDETTIDDLTLPTMTIRVWVMGISACVAKAFLSSRSMFQEDTLDLPFILVVNLAICMGQSIAVLLPNKSVKDGTNRTIVWNTVRNYWDCSSCAFNPAAELLSDAWSSN